MSTRKKPAAKRCTAYSRQSTDTRTEEALRFIGNVVLPLVQAIMNERAADRAHELTILEKDREYALKRLETAARGGDAMEDLLERFNDVVQSAAAAQATMQAARAAAANGAAEQASDESAQAE